MSRNANQEDVKVEVSTETLTQEVPTPEATAADEFVPATDAAATQETAGTEPATIEDLPSGPAVETVPEGTPAPTPEVAPTAFTTAEVKPAKVEKPAKAAKGETAPKVVAPKGETVSVKMKIELAYKANRFNKGDTVELSKSELEDLLPAWYDVV